MTFLRKCRSHTGYPVDNLIHPAFLQFSFPYPEIHQMLTLYSKRFAHDIHLMVSAWTVTECNVKGWRQRPVPVC
ncbi:TPA: hypothetical protein QFT68_005659 [Raoultella ornithinolytica]|nr:hypothetical protein [Raoultella ornithinolytica]